MGRVCKTTLNGGTGVRTLEFVTASFSGFLRSLSTWDLDPVHPGLGTGRPQRTECEV